MYRSITQHSVNSNSTSASAMGRSLRKHGCGNSSLSCAGPPPVSKYQPSRAKRSVHPRRVRWPQRPSCAIRWANSAVSTTLLASRFTIFADGGESFSAARLIAAHCASNACGLRFVCVNVHKRVYLCCSLQVLRCARAGLWRLLSCPDVAGVHLVRSTHRALLQGACAITTCVNLVGEQIAHVHTQEFHPLTRLSQCRLPACLLETQLAPLPWRQSIVVRMFAAIISPHQQCGTHPGPPSCSKLSLEGLRISSLDALVMAMRVILTQHLENGARPVPRAPQFMPDHPHGWE